jgi:hypothetical protein
MMKEPPVAIASGMPAGHSFVFTGLKMVAAEGHDPPTYGL